jgi:hypothetical protein
MKLHIDPELLPILTETADGTVLDLPVLTEAVEERLTVAPAPALMEEQCRQLADQLYPALEILLRDAIGSRSETRWEKSMQQVRGALPDLIRTALKEPR